MHGPWPNLFVDRFGLCTSIDELMVTARVASDFT
jgi:hypothetical protein